MKRFLRVPFTILLLITAAAVLSLRSAARRGGGSLGGGAVVVRASVRIRSLPDAANTTLVRLSSVEVVEAALRREVEELLDGDFSAAVTADLSRVTYRPMPLYRRGNRIAARSRVASRIPIALRSPKNLRIMPEFRRSLRDWFRSRRFQPRVLMELVGRVKRPIDQHLGREDDGGRRYGTCAVVGNSGILLKHDHGELIDGHDFVIRLNNARTQGYQRNVGKKTNLSFVNSNILHLCSRRESCFCHPYGETIPIIMYICQAVHFLDYTVCNSSHKAPLLITDPRFDLLCARIVKYYSLKRFFEETGRFFEDWTKVHDEKLFHYSSGMQAILLATGICDNVSVFGFGKLTGARHHYHTNQKAELDLHDYEAEYAFYQDLIERPHSVPFLKDSGFQIPPLVFYR